MTKPILQREISQIANNLANRIVEALRDATLEDLSALNAPKPGRKPAIGRPRKGLRKSLAEALDTQIGETPASPPAVYDDSSAGNNPDLAQLSARELQVFNAIIQQRRTTEISRDLNLSPKTVSTYKRRIFTKLKMENDAQLILYAAREGMV